MAERRERARRKRVPAPLNPYLQSVLRTFRPGIAAVFVFSFCINLLTLSVPLYLLQIYSKVLPGQNLDTLWYLTAIALLAIAALGLLEAIRRSMLTKSAVKFDHLVSEHLLSSAIQRAIEKSYVSVNVLRDLATIRSFLGGSTMLPLLDMPWTPLFIAILFVLHPLLGMVGLLGALLMLALAVGNELLTREPLKRAGQESRDMFEQARAYVSNADVVQAMGMQGIVNVRWRRDNTAALGSHYRAGSVTARFASISKIVRLCLQIGIICVAAWLIVQQQLTAGATIASVLLLRRAIAPLEQSIRSWKSVVGARSALQNISEYLDHSSTLAAESELPSPDGELIAENLSFKHAGADRSVFSRVRLTLKPGTITVLKGPTGAGKSTLFRTLAGIASPTAGKITIDGFDLQLWPQKQRAYAIGYMPQQVCLFPGSVRDNISRLEPAPIDKVVAAAKRARVHKLIQGLEHGYDTELTAEGANLSGGQRQSVGLARALFGNPRLVLLDEPDASLDNRGRSRLRRSLRSLRRDGVVVLLITHRSSLERLADQVLELEGGKLRSVNPEGGSSVDGNATTAESAHASEPAQEVDTVYESGIVQQNQTDQQPPGVTSEVAEQAAVGSPITSRPTATAKATSSAIKAVGSGGNRAVMPALSVVRLHDLEGGPASEQRFDDGDGSTIRMASQDEQAPVSQRQQEPPSNQQPGCENTQIIEPEPLTHSEITDQSTSNREDLQARVDRASAHTDRSPVTTSASDHDTDESQDCTRHLQRIRHKRNRWASQDRRIPTRGKLKD